MIYGLEFMQQFDQGDYDFNISYVGPFFAPDWILIILSQDEMINYLAYLHDMAYKHPLGHSVDTIDNEFVSAIIIETGNTKIAQVYGSFLRTMNFISWNKSRLFEWYENLKKRLK